jgi:GTP:adenosylcobinamide-phosphate guanylyltransferase
MTGFTVAILAAQRTGVVNPLAEAHGVSHKCLVPICGKPLIAHVLGTICAMPEVVLVRIVVEAETHPALEPLLAPFRAAGQAIELVASRPGIADSAIAGVEGAPAPWIITTADNVLLTPEAVRAMVAAMDSGGADVTAALTSADAIRRAHPEGQRRFYHFKDGPYSNCNLYGIKGPDALAATEVFREGGQFMNNPKRLIKAFGLINILLMKWKWVTLAGAMKRASARFGLTMREVVFDDGALAIDVDNARTYDIARGILAKRVGWTSDEP